MTQPKIKIKDDTELRCKIDILYESTSQIKLAQWAIICAKHVLLLCEIETDVMREVESNIKILELWQDQKASVHEVRQAGFRAHALARNCENEIYKTALRAVGQAIGVGHMKEHAMVCSDYAIKTVQLTFPDNIQKITEEREWQLHMLQQI